MAPAELIPGPGDLDDSQVVAICPCPCGARPEEPCRTKQGHPRQPHVIRGKNALVLAEKWS